MNWIWICPSSAVPEALALGERQRRPWGRGRRRTAHRSTVQRASRPRPILVRQVPEQGRRRTTHPALRPHAIPDEVADVQLSFARREVGPPRAEGSEVANRGGCVLVPKGTRRERPPSAPVAAGGARPDPGRCPSPLIACRVQRKRSREDGRRAGSDTSRGQRTAHSPSARRHQPTDLAAVALDALRRPVPAEAPGDA